MRISLRKALLVLLTLLYCSPARAATESGWQHAPDDPLGAHSPLATLGPDGQLYLLGSKVLPNSTAGPAGSPHVEAMQVYSFERQRWSKLPQPPAAIDFLATAAGHIYGIGEKQGVDSEAVRFFAPPTGRWIAVHSAYCCSSFGAVTVDRAGRIYLAAGNQRTYGIGSGLQIYDPRADRWTILTPLPQALANPAATIGPDGRMYVLGGVAQDRAGGTIYVTNKVEAFDPNTDRWSIVAPMHVPRAGLAVVTGPDGRIYAIGGRTDTMGFGPHRGTLPHRLRSVEIYDPRSNRWSFGPNLRVARGNPAGVVGPDHRIYVIGGDNTDAVETLAVPVKRS